MYSLVCIECGKEWGDDRYTCECGGLLEVRLKLDEIDVNFRLDGQNITVWKYRSLLPVRINPITLNEG